MRLGTRLASYAISDAQGARKKVLDKLATNRSKESRMAIKSIVVLVIVLTLAFIRPSGAQQSNTIVRIGLISQSSPSAATQIESLLQGLRELGYLEGKNISFERRYAQGELDRLAALVGELLRTKVDVIVATSTPATLAAKKTTNEIPIVFHVIKIR
jgi:ABC-type uncharacterized transport system substrate-binding protein